MKILFIIINSLSGLFVGMFLGKFFLSDGIGLAGGASLLGYGVMGGFIAMISSFFLAQKVKRDLQKNIAIILFALNLIVIVWIIYRLQSNQHEQEIHRKPATGNTESAIIPIIFYQTETDVQEGTGLGMAKPNFYEKRLLYFYSAPNLEKAVSEHIPSDSLVFSQTDQHQYEINYAPPWFHPEHMTMDYEILFLKLLTLGRDWAEVEVNKQTQLSSWIDASQVQILLWPEFLLNVYSVENLDPINNLLRIGPFSSASPLITKKYSALSPIMIKESWIKVNVLNDNYSKIGEGWLRWIENGKLLVSYSLLS